MNTIVRRIEAIVNALAALLPFGIPIEYGKGGKL